MTTLAALPVTTPPAHVGPASRSVRGLLALEGGTAYAGELRGAPLPAEGELIFTTAATGWGEILTDPSYAGQIVILTHPMVGNYRIRSTDLESARVHARALVVTRLVTPPGEGISVEELLLGARIPVITGIDTRALTLALRRGAGRRAVIWPGNVDTDHDEAVAAAAASSPWNAVDHVASVAPRDGYRIAAEGAVRGRAVLIDYGVKRSLLAALTERGLDVVGLPPDATAGAVAAHEPDLVVLSPGPGDPSTMQPQIAVVADLLAAATAGGPPLLGICLGHQLLGLAAGAPTRRLPVGHHGGNHGVIESATGRVTIGAHNHEVAVVDHPALAAAGMRVSHRDLNDDTVEGLVHVSGRVASVQFHPEGAPGPTDAAGLFDTALLRTRLAGSAGA